VRGRQLGPRHREPSRDAAGAEDDAVGFDATATFKRSDFGIKTYLPYIGDELSVDISTEAHATK